MKIGEIKIEALKLMRENVHEDITFADLPELYESRNYGDLLVNMNASISRALDRIAALDKLPLAVVELTDYLDRETPYSMRYYISDISDYDCIFRVVHESEYEYDDNIPARFEGSSILILPKINHGEYRLIYQAKPPRVTANSIDGDNLRISDKLARLIPYFIKSELYEEEEPAIAQAARAAFENGISEVETPDRNPQRMIKKVLRY
ncbi:hypothetical protein FACS1894211_12750 [Clostridia bacterium]|nr:hypothetical protein FACS1894211_12750 [Clostridia bacterium]